MLLYVVSNAETKSMSGILSEKKDIKSRTHAALNTCPQQQ